jgi:ubiquinone biosynthesis protein
VDTGAIGYVSKKLGIGLLNFFDDLSVYDYDLCAQRLNEMAEKGIYGERFEKGMFFIIKSLMFLDGMILRCNPDAVLLEDMRQFVSEFKKGGGK